MGSETSRPFTEEAARQSAAVLVLEPGTGLKGKLKTARKGVGDYTVTVQGRASHAGVDFRMAPAPCWSWRTRSTKSPHSPN